MISGRPGEFDLVFFHRDHGTNDRVWAEWIEPLRAAWKQRDLREILVPVVPVTEIEAWLLADGGAVRQHFGVRLDDKALGIPTQPAGVERIADPKQVLTRLEQRSSRGAAADRMLLADRIRLENLRQVPAFRMWWDETHAALRELGYRPSA